MPPKGKGKARAGDGGDGNDGGAGAGRTWSRPQDVTRRRVAPGRPTAAYALPPRGRHWLRGAPPRALARAARHPQGFALRGAAADALARWPPLSPRRGRFQRIVRTFAPALYFNELANVVGPENQMNGDEQRCLGLFMLALWHAAQPHEPAELCQARCGARRLCALRADARALGPSQHRAHAKQRKRDETDWMSPTNDPQQLCNFTALARARPAAAAHQASNCPDAPPHASQAA